MEFSDSYREWSLDQIEQFEEGLREYGKDFFKITIFKVITIPISTQPNLSFDIFAVSKPNCARSNSLLLSMEKE